MVPCLWKSWNACAVPFVHVCVSTFACLGACMSFFVWSLKKWKIKKWNQSKGEKKKRQRGDGIGLCVRETLDEQQLQGSLSALARAGNHRSSPCWHALTVRVWLYVCEWMSECVYALKREMVKEILFPHVSAAPLKCSCEQKRSVCCILYRRWMLDHLWMNINDRPKVEEHLGPMFGNLHIHTAQHPQLFHITGSRKGVQEGQKELSRQRVQL